MFAVMFEVQPWKDRWNDYLELAKYLKPKLEAIDGFIDNERFASTRTEGRLLSLSTWRDEKALIRWRTLGEHHAVQEKGRNAIFEDYHLRVGEIIRDTAAAVEQSRTDETEIGLAKICSLTEIEPDAAAAREIDPGADGLIDQELFESITTPGRKLLFGSWRDRAAAEAWTAQASGPRHRLVRVIRDYGLFDRREAPQYYPAVERPE